MRVAFPKLTMPQGRILTLQAKASYGNIHLQQFPTTKKEKKGLEIGYRLVVHLHSNVEKQTADNCQDASDEVEVSTDH